jgi:hypothetical protein
LEAQKYAPRVRSIIGLEKEDAFAPFLHSQDP